MEKHPFLVTVFVVTFLIFLVFSMTASLAVCSVTLNTDWKLTITGLVDTPLNLTIADLMTMPQTTLFAQIYCAGPPGFFVEEGNWTGVELKFLLQKAGIDPAAIKIAFHASDGFSTDLTPLFAMDESVLVAYEKNNSPLDETLRLVVPGRWGYKWIYHLDRIEVVNYNFLGKYESQGYSDTALTTMSAGPGDVGSQLPNPTTLNINRSSPTPRPTPSITSIISSPYSSATNATTPNIEPGNGSIMEGVVYFTAISIIVVATVSLYFYLRKRSKRINRF